MAEAVEVQLSRLIIQEKDLNQFIYLTVKGQTRSFPIVIGFPEANEIKRKLRHEEPQRPMTHDLVTRVLRASGMFIERVEISDLQDNTFYATLHLQPEDGEGEEKLVDCRPSDAIALAVQARTPIYVARKVLDLVAPELG